MYRQPAQAARSRLGKGTGDLARSGSGRCRRRWGCLPATTTAAARCWRPAGSSGLHVPEDVAVLGVDNDDVFCELSDPPLSSVALNAETAGYRAAELLDGMMQGKIRKPRRIMVEAVGVVTRRSTEVIAVKDYDVATALQFIRREQGRGISVDRVADEVAMSRRSLEKRFRDTIGRTILEEIQLVRLERAKRLLLETTYPISKVAEISGFGSTGYFIQFFQKRVGKTPRKYRVDLAS